MTKLVFMSPEHVAAMNAILAGDRSVLEACAQLAKPVTMGYQLVDGPGGETVHWRVTIAKTVQFSLGKGNSDVLLTGDWGRVIRASQAQREGTECEPGVVPSGDLSLLASVAPVLAIASRVATLPVEFPETGGCCQP
jgi:hypothetical protein